MSTGMRVVACLKHVPDVQGERGLGPDGRVVREAGDSTLDDVDQHTLEAALTLAGEAGEVVALTMGPDHARASLRRALGMGADRGVHVCDAALAGSDVFATAAVLAAVVLALGADGGVDLVLTGAASSDGATSVLAALLGAELGLPAAGPAVELTVDDGVVRVRCDTDAGSEVLEADLPAVVGVSSGLNRPRYPTAAGLRAARSRPIATWTLASLGVDPACVGTGAARVAVRAAERRGARADRVLLEDDGTAATALAAYLVEKGLVR